MFCVFSLFIKCDGFFIDIYTMSTNEKVVSQLSNPCGQLKHTHDITHEYIQCF